MFYSKLRDDFQGFLRTFVIYACIVGVSVCVLLLSGFTVFRAGNSMGLYIVIFLLISFAFLSRIRLLGNVEQLSEDVIRKKDQMITNLKRENSRLIADSKNQRLTVLDMDWVMEINFAELRTEQREWFDYLTTDGKEYSPWVGSSDEAKNKPGTKRAIGFLTVPHTIKIGIDLREVIVSFDPEQKKVYYSMPEHFILGTKDADPQWEFRMSLECTKGFLRKEKWELKNEDGEELSIFREKSEVSMKSISSCHSKLDRQLFEFFRSEGRKRVEGLFRSILRMDAVFVEDISSVSSRGNVMKLQDFLSQQRADIAAIA